MEDSLFLFGIKLVSFIKYLERDVENMLAGSNTKNNRFIIVRDIEKLLPMLVAFR